MKITKYAVAVLGLIALLTPTSKADTFVYQVTSTIDNIDLIFALPSFQEFVDTTTFTLDTSTAGPVTELILSGNSTDCSAGPVTITGPCFLAVLSPVNFDGDTGPSFTGPGAFKETFFGDTTTVTITDVPTAAPEPSSLASIAIGFGALLLMRKRMTRQFAR
jgi:hypothetical protein